MYNYYGYNESLKINKDTDYKNIKTPKDLYDLLSLCWCKETCAPRLQDKWSIDNKTLGQCSVTAFLCQDIFGGDVYATKTANGIHCYNVVDNIVFDLTSEQFKDLAKNLDYNEMIFQKRSDDHHFKKEEKYQRYLNLKKRLKEAAGE